MRVRVERDTHLFIHSYLWWGVGGGGGGGEWVGGFGCVGGFCSLVGVGGYGWGLRG